MVRIRKSTLEEVLKILDTEIIKVTDNELYIPTPKGDITIWSDSEEFFSITLEVQLKEEQMIQLLKFLRALS